MKKLISILLVTVMVILGISACGQKNPSAKDSTTEKNTDKKIKVVTTIFPEYDWVKEIAGYAGENMEITMLLDNGVDLHSYQPTTADLAKVSDCDLFIYVGGESDAWCEIDKEHKDIYSENEKNYEEKLDTLDKKYQETVDAASKKTLLFGDRFPFRYMVDDYGLDYYAAFVGCSAETEASFKTIKFLAEKAGKLELKNVMTIEKSDQKIAKTIIDNTKNKDQNILTLDSMQSTTSEDVKSGTTYLSVMENNLNVLKEVLQ